MNGLVTFGHRWTAGSRRSWANGFVTGELFGAWSRIYDYVTGEGVCYGWKVLSQMDCLIIYEGFSNGSMVWSRMNGSVTDDRLGHLWTVWARENGLVKAVMGEWFCNRWIVWLLVTGERLGHGWKVLSRVKGLVKDERFGNVWMFGQLSQWSQMNGLVTGEQMEPVAAYFGPLVLLVLSKWLDVWFWALLICVDIILSASEVDARKLLVFLIKFAKVTNYVWMASMISFVFISFGFTEYFLRTYSNFYTYTQNPSEHTEQTKKLYISVINILANPVNFSQKSGKHNLLKARYLKLHRFKSLSTRVPLEYLFLTRRRISWSSVCADKCFHDSSWHCSLYTN